MAKSHLEVYMEGLLTKWGDWVRVKDLVKEGIVGSEAQATHLVRSGDGPAHVRVGGRILFKKQDVVEWMKKNYRRGNV